MLGHPNIEAAILWSQRASLLHPSQSGVVAVWVHMLSNVDGLSLRWGNYYVVVLTV